MLRFHHLSKHYTHFDLQNISFEAPEGARIALLGLNGSGKSTLLRCIADQHPQASLLPQRLDFPLSCTALELVLFSRSEHKKYFHFDQQEDLEKAKYYLELTHAAEFSHRQLDEISGGELQRVALASLLAHEKNLLLLDEPFTFLDVREQNNMLKLFAKLQQQNPKLTIIMSSHQLELMQTWCSHVLILQKGKLRSFSELSKNSNLFAMFEELA